MSVRDAQFWTCINYWKCPHCGFMVDGSKPTEFVFHYNKDVDDSVEHMECPNCKQEAIYTWWIR